MRRDDELTPEEVARADAMAQGADLWAEAYQRDGRTFGLDLGIGLDEPPRSAAALCSVAFDVAQRLTCSVFDPQLGRIVPPSEQERVVEHFTQSAGYVSAGFARPTQGATPARPVSTRFWLVLLGLLLLLLLAGRALSCAAR